MLSAEMKRDLALAAACAGGIAILLAPASVVTLGIGLAVGYKGQDTIKALLEGGGKA